MQGWFLNMAVFLVLKVRNVSGEIVDLTWKMNYNFSVFIMHKVEKTLGHLRRTKQ